MTSVFNSNERRTKNGFTLTELLVVITIIAILLGLLYGAIRTVSRFSRETITRTELANIEAAWKQYYSYYHTWPTNDVEKLIDSSTSWKYETDGDGAITYELGPQFRLLLSGTTFSNCTPSLNADGVAFLDLTRFEVGTGAPINAWGNRGKHYFVKLDING